MDPVTPEDRIRATYIVDLLDAAMETLPPECRPLDPATCPHVVEARKTYRDGRTQCLDCGTELEPPRLPMCPSCEIRHGLPIHYD